MFDHFYSLIFIVSHVKEIAKVRAPDFPKPMTTSWDDYPGEINEAYVASESINII